MKIPRIKGLPKIAPKKEEPADSWNRALFRRGGLQGRKGSSLVKTVIRFVKGVDDKPEEKWQGVVRGKFFGPGKRPALYLSHSYDWLSRAVRRKAISSGKLKRIMARKRAGG